MSERGQFRNTRGPRGGGGRGGRGGAHKHSNGGGGGGAHAGGAAADKDKDKERPKKENILDLNRFMDKQMKVKFNGGREGKGIPRFCACFAPRRRW
jgi:U6 snRNA-associated Sm-like protein LSm7